MVLRTIQEVLHNSNPFVQCLQTNTQCIQDNRSISLSIGIVETIGTDPCLYNCPTVTEVAALIPTSAQTA